MNFRRGDYLLVYDGVLLSAVVAATKDQTYMYYITHDRKEYGYLLIINFFIHHIGSTA
jgi:hypothetical protein